MNAPGRVCGRWKRGYRRKRQRLRQRDHFSSGYSATTSGFAINRDKTFANSSRERVSSPVATDTQTWCRPRKRASSEIDEEPLKHAGVSRVSTTFCISSRGTRTDLSWVRMMNAAGASPATSVPAGAGIRLRRPYTGESQISFECLEGQTSSWMGSSAFSIGSTKGKSGLM